MHPACRVTGWGRPENGTVGEKVHHGGQFEQVKPKVPGPWSQASPSRTAAVNIWRLDFGYLSRLIALTERGLASAQLSAPSRRSARSEAFKRSGHLPCITDYSAALSVALWPGSWSRPQVVFGYWQAGRRAGSAAGGLSCRGWEPPDD